MLLTAFIYPDLETAAPLFLSPCPSFVTLDLTTLLLRYLLRASYYVLCLDLEATVPLSLSPCPTFFTLSPRPSYSDTGLGNITTTKMLINSFFNSLKDLKENTTCLYLKRRSKEHFQ